MKHLLLSAALLVPLGAVAQVSAVTESATPFKGCNTITIHTQDSTDTALNKLARALIVAGIEPDKIESQIGYLTTKAKPVGQLSPATFQYRAIASRERGGTLLSITGTYSVQLSAAKAMTESMYWVKGNLLQAKQCFVTVQKAAEAYPNGHIGYLQKKTP